MKYKYRAQKREMQRDFAYGSTTVNYQKKEQNELESKIDTRKIDWTPPPKDWWKNL